MNELTDILEQEFDIYAKYLKLAEKKKEALTRTISIYYLKLLILKENFRLKFYN